MLRNDIALMQLLRCIPKGRDLQKSAHCGMRIFRISHSAAVWNPRLFAGTSRKGAVTVRPPESWKCYVLLATPIHPASDLQEVRRVRNGTARGTASDGFLLSSIARHPQQLDPRCLYSIEPDLADLAEYSNTKTGPDRNDLLEYARAKPRSHCRHIPQF
mgnify:CR=1 FL=1